MDFLHSILFFIIAIGVLVAFHEFGHYWVAVKSGVRVLRFSVGFGKPLITWKRNVNGSDVEYVIAAIPLGGYVKMLDERETKVAEQDRPYAFNTQPLLTRAAIVAAGPIFNFILAIILYWLVFLAGITVERALMGQPKENSIAAVSGFQNHDEVLKIGDELVQSWVSFRMLILDQGLDGGILDVQVKTIDDVVLTRQLDLTGTHLLERESDVIADLGFSHWWPDLPAMIGGVVEASPAQQAGLREGDKIVTLNGDKILHWQEMVERVEKSAGKPMDFVIERDQQQMSLIIIPGVKEKQGETKGVIGAYQKTPDGLKEKILIDIEYGVFGSISAAVVKTWDMSKLTVRVLWKMIVGEASLKNISGPLTIAKYAGVTADLGLMTYLGFLALISVSLGVLNLFPIPMLDGGHLFYYLIEAIKGSPVSEAFELRGQQVGIALLVMLMCVAFYNDFQRFMP